jgi:hypothetical protein
MMIATDHYAIRVAGPVDIAGLRDGSLALDEEQVRRDEGEEGHVEGLPAEQSRGQR